MKYLKPFNENLKDIIDSGQYFLSLEDEGFYIEVKEMKDRSYILPCIMIYKSNVKLNNKRDLIEFKYDEIKDDLIRFIEMNDKIIKNIYAESYDKIGLLNLKSNYSIYDSDNKIGRILRLIILFNI